MRSDMLVVLVVFVVEQEECAVGIGQQVVVAEGLNIPSLVVLDKLVKTPFFVVSVMLKVDT